MAFSLLPGIRRARDRWLIVVDRTFTSGSVDLRVSLFTDHRRVILFFACLILAGGLDPKIILTAKFSNLRYPGVALFLNFPILN